MSAVEPEVQKTSRARGWLWAVPQALGMGLLARACSLGSSALFAAAPLVQADVWWSQAPGWLALVWVSKKAARVGWWTVEAAWMLGAAALCASAGAALQGYEWMGAGWLASTLWACLWPKARAQVLAAEGRTAHGKR